MNSLIESLNMWGARFVDFALPILWQSSLLIAVVLVFDFLLRRKIRPAVRYTLWFVVFVKLLLPPTLALPTGAAWWLRTRPVQVVMLHTRTLTISYRDPVAAPAPMPVLPRVHFEPPPARLSREAWALLGSGIVSVLLAAWSVYRWRQISQCVRKTTAPTGEIQEMLEEASRRAGLRKDVRLRLTAESMSPAVCGLFRPVVLLPQSLIERLTPHQLQAVLLHELIHLRRGDVWVNCAQTLLQIVYWWHPLLWFANARVRRVREEAVDDAVMFALSEESEIYAPTLLEVAKLAFNRPLATLGLVGILESRNALRHRIERLLNFTTPRRVGVSAVSVICIAAFTALAVPMGEPPAALQTGDHSEDANLITFHAKINPEIFIRNIKARAGETMHTTNDDWNDILISILEGFGVDCAPPRNITFNAETGELSMQNTSQALQAVDEVVKELSLAGGERILNPPYGLKQVLIEAQFYQWPPEGVDGFHLAHGEQHHEGDLSPWYELSSSDLTWNRQQLKQAGIKPISSPRIQTSHGITASLFVGDETNNIQLECVPFIHDGRIDLTALARTMGTYAPDGKGWPDLAGHTNCAIFARMNIADGNGVALIAHHAGATSQDWLLVLLKAKIVKPEAKVPVMGAVPAEANVGSMGGGRVGVPLVTSDGRQGVYEKLNDLTFDKVAFPNLNLGEVLTNLTEMTRRRDPSHEGVKLSINPAPAPRLGSANDDLVFADLALVNISLDPGLKNVRLLDVLEAIVRTADYPIAYSLLEDGTVQFSFKGSDELFTRTFKVDPAGLVRAMKMHGIITNDVDRLKSVADIQAPLVIFFKEMGLDLQPPESVLFSYQQGEAHAIADDLNPTFNYQQGVLIAHATAKDLNRIQTLISFNFGLQFLPPGTIRRTNGSPLLSSIPIGGSSTAPEDVQFGQLIQDGKLLYQTGKLDEAELKLNQALEIQPDNRTARYYLILVRQERIGARADARNVTSAANRSPAPNLYARTNTIYTSPERQKIYEKLNTIRFDKVAFPNLQLSEVVRNLTELTYRRDIDQKGINFILNYAKPSASPNGQPQDFYPTTGQPIAAPSAIASEDVDLRAVTISLEPGLKDVRLVDVLEAIVKSADHPIKYSLLDYGVEFSLKGPDTPVLHTRTFKVDPNTFYMNLQSTGVVRASNAVASGNSTGLTGGGGQQRGLRNAAGPDSAAFQLAVINFFNAVGVNLAAPKSVFFNDRQGTLTVHATDDDLELIEEALNTLLTMPPQVTLKVRFIAMDDEAIRRPEFEPYLKSVTNQPTGVASIVTEPKLKTLLKKLEQTKAAEFLDEARITTLSGRQAQIQVDNAQADSLPVFSSYVINTNFFDTNNPITLDVVAEVGADGYTIQLTLIPTQTELLKADKASSPVASYVPPVPVGRVHQEVVNATVWDGQTAILRFKSYLSEKASVIILVTPTIIDPSGNRVHSSDYYDGPIY